MRASIDGTASRARGATETVVITSRKTVRRLLLGLVSVVLVAGCGATTTQGVSSPAPTSTPTAAAPTGGTSTDTGTLSACDPNVSANGSTSCPFAENVFRAYAAQYEINGSSSDINVQASSPVTGRSYGMRCHTIAAVVTCLGGTNARVVFALHAVQVYRPTRSQSPAPTHSAPPTSVTASAPPPAPTEDVGSTSHAGDAQFCSTHSCIPNFPNGNGTVVQCVDGEYSHSGGLSGACSGHGGEQ